MILLHLLDDSEILMNLKQILYVQQYTHSTSITYKIGEKEHIIVVKETPSEIQELINKIYITF